MNKFELPAESGFVVRPPLLGTVRIEGAEDVKITLASLTRTHAKLIVTPPAGKAIRLNEAESNNRHFVLAAERVV